MNQADTMLDMLERNPDGVCGVTFAQVPIARYGARLGELRGAGYTIDRTPCVDRWHRHETRQWTYRLSPESTLF